MPKPAPVHVSSRTERVTLLLNERDNKFNEMRREIERLQRMITRETDGLFYKVCSVSGADRLNGVYKDLIAKTVGRNLHYGSALMSEMNKIDWELETNRSAVLAFCALADLHTHNVGDTPAPTNELAMQGGADEQEI